MHFKKLKFPSAQTILIIISGIVALLTWIIPAGKYDSLSYDTEAKTFIKTSLKTTTTLPATQQTLDSLQIKIPIEKFTSGAIYKPIGIPKTYQQLDAQPQGFVAFVQSPIKGIIAAADIIFLVLIIGGLIGIMNLTGAFDAGIAWLAKALEGREFILIILVTCLVALGGTTFGLAEETIAFFPILIPVFIAAKYDAMVGLACIFLGSSIGTMCSTVNPFSTIIASDAAGINWTTGLTGRFLMLIIILSISLLYILRYAKRVKNDPTKSIIYDQKEEIEALFHLKKSTSNLKLTNRLRLILLVFTLSFVIMIVGVSKLDWWFVEMTSTFLVAAIIIGFIAKIKEVNFVEAFSKGAGELLGVAFIIGIARGVSVLMDDGLISDTMLYHASTVTEGMNKGVFVNVMLYIYGGLSFFIPSSSGMAVLTMPVMSPLADTVGVGREIIVNTYQYGLGLFYFINPTGLILASLAIVKIGFNKWLKFITPLFIILVLVTMLVLTISVYL
ncbi:YfcC family protein [Aureibaculum marinum]|uniref:YfcC family protein n=1 Tax=Aureibaculum marinum TaxID=2487930 RepID=A0A3N4NIS9_9FLAO|nr:YfcC family protein [Aureibaculum marinum]RPD94578.1 YfcC family protein [Aureibaculum marinum]